MASKQATNRLRLFALLAVLVFAIVALAPFAMGQATVGTGAISGTVTDPTGAVVAGAKVTISSKGTAQSVLTSTNQTGAYSSGPLLPGSYAVRIEKGGFATLELATAVQVGTTTTANAKLSIGEASKIVNVEASGVQVNTEQATVQGVLTTQQIEQLPINGRNFLDLAQLQPGVQIQDGGNFDPTKNGFMSISFAGRYGRTARIEVDGVDISDETVGTTTQNIPEEAIQEFQVAQSSLDVATELTSSGTVNVVTRTGTNSYHGEGFYAFRDSSMAAHLPGPVSDFQRNQMGGRVGGPLVKDKLFFFIAGEHTHQNLIAPQVFATPFDSLSGGDGSPFHESMALGRLDWQIKPDNYRLFYRFTYHQNGDTLAFVPNSYQPFINRDKTPAHAIGFDFTRGNLTNSIRFGYTKFQNNISDASNTVGGAFNPAPSVELSIGPAAFCISGGNSFCSGTPFLAPQKTFQTNKQLKYDGSWLHHNHTIRFGGDLNRISGGGFAGFLADGPAVNSLLNASTEAFAAAGPFPGGASNPLNYPAQTVLLGNGQGFSTEFPAFGFAGSGQFAYRFGLYIGDVWKAKSNLTINMALRWSADTGRTDSDLGAITCAESPSAPAGCTGNLLDNLAPGAGRAVRQPYTDFGPQLGITYDPWKNGKTVFRAGIGLFYENVIFNNVLFDRPARLQNGIFLSIGAACSGGSAGSVAIPNGPTVVPDFCGLPIGATDPATGMPVWQAAAALEAQLAAASKNVGSGKNPAFIGNTLCNSGSCTGDTMFAPNFRTPRSVQINVGMQRELKRGTVLSVDYVRNVGLRYLLASDINHVGSAKFLNVAAAQAAIAQTLAFCGAASINASFQNNCPTDPANGTNDGGTYVPRPATIADYGVNGISDGNTHCFGGPCPSAAFGGANTNFGSIYMLNSNGRSVYNGLQIELRSNVSNPVRGIKNLNLDLSYALSRFNAMALDQDFINFAVNGENPHQFFGPSSLDRTHQLSFGITAEMPFGFRTSFIGHFYSPLATNMLVPTTGNPADVLISDLLGDGGFGGGGGIDAPGAPMPGTNIGSFGRGVNAGNINTVIGNYNQNFAGCTGPDPSAAGVTCSGQPTPAGQALIAAGLFTLPQLQALGGVMQPVPLAPKGQVNLDWMRAFDLSISRPIKIGERVVVEPSVGIFNLMNFSNFDPAGGLLLSNVLTGTCGSINGTTYGPSAACNGGRPDRVGVGSGLFNLGAPRVIEWGLKISF